MKIPNKVRYINKKFTNRIMMKIAGKKHSPIVLIEHVGRQTGKVYRIPIMAAPYKEGFMFALTYGTGVDWYKNILASNSAKLVYKGKSFSLSNPVVIQTRRGQDAFTFPANLILRGIGIRDFFFMKATSLPGRS
jgi:deazaflavin-dependent oxidoreductase (nitroreductase family)